MNGIELGIKLRQLGYDGKIIYLTSSVEFAIDLFKAKAYNYILKPITAILSSLLSTTYFKQFRQKPKTILLSRQKKAISKFL